MTLWSGLHPLLLISTDDLLVREEKNSNDSLRMGSHFGNVAIVAEHVYTLKGQGLDIRMGSK